MHTALISITLEYGFEISDKKILTNLSTSSVWPKRTMEGFKNLLTWDMFGELIIAMMEPIH